MPPAFGQLKFCEDAIENHSVQLLGEVVEQAQNMLWNNVP